MIKKLSLFFFLICFCLLTGGSLHYLKKGFSLRRVQCLEHLFSEDVNREAEEALQQTYRYLGRGRQCFAFVSEDGKYVLKFPRTDIYKTPFWVKALPFSSYREKLEKNHQIRETFILNSFQLSLNELKKQTGLIATHLGQSEPRGKVLKIVDAMGYKYHLPLHKTLFVLQHKHPLLMQSFCSAFKEGKKEEAEKILDSLLQVIEERAQKGILNRDRSFLKNYGFDGETAYQIDIGSFFKDPRLDLQTSYEKSIRDSTDPIREWVCEHAPEMIDSLNSKIEHLIH
jgi:hypothetical protein